MKTLSPRAFCRRPSSGRPAGTLGHASPLPVQWLVERVAGWHLSIHIQTISSNELQQTHGVANDLKAMTSSGIGGLDNTLHAEQQYIVYQKAIMY